MSCGHDGWQDGCADCKREHDLAAAHLEHRPFFSWPDRPGFYLLLEGEPDAMLGKPEQEPT